MADLTKRPAPAVLMIAYTNYESDPRVSREAEAAAEGGFEVDFIALRRPGQPAEERLRGVRVVRLAQERYRGGSHVQYALSYLEFFVRCMVKSLALFATRRYRVVHVNNMPDALVWAVAPLKLLGAAVVLDIHDPMPETFGAKFGSGGRSGLFRILLLAERLSVWLADRTITVSEPVKTGVLLKHGYAADAIGVVANFADDELFALQPYPSLDGKVVFAFHGTILERNGLGTLIEALRLVRRRDRISVRIIGEGDFSGTLSALIASHGLGDVVDFRNRSYPLREIPGLLADCHVGLVPLRLSSVAEYALPLKLVEYTCLGMPSISIRNAAIDYYFRPDECLFFEAGDTAALAALIDRVAEDPRLLLPYRDKLLPARERLLWAGEKKKYIEMLRQLSGRTPAAGVETTQGTAG
jgi:glycosyltransferase involved in cell wall biosynthesis